MIIEGWVTALTLAFGVVAAVVGVAAYLRLYRRQNRDSIKSVKSPQPERDLHEDPNDDDSLPRE